MHIQQPDANFRWNSLHCRLWWWIAAIFCIGIDINPDWSRKVRTVDWFFSFFNKIVNIYCFFFLTKKNPSKLQIQSFKFRGTIFFGWIIRSITFHRKHWRSYIPCCYLCDESKRSKSENNTQRLINWWSRSSFSW